VIGIEQAGWTEYIFTTVLWNYERRETRKSEAWRPLRLCKRILEIGRRAYEKATRLPAFA
jgi:hypothetical protein